MCSRPTTAGIPYSRATTEPWVIKPPTVLEFREKAPPAKRDERMLVSRALLVIVPSYESASPIFALSAKVLYNKKSTKSSAKIEV